MFPLLSWHSLALCSAAALPLLPARRLLVRKGVPKPTSDIFSAHTANDGDWEAEDV